MFCAEAWWLRSDMCVWLMVARWSPTRSLQWTIRADSWQTLCVSAGWLSLSEANIGSLLTDKLLHAWRPTASLPKSLHEKTYHCMHMSPPVTMCIKILNLVLSGLVLMLSNKQPSQLIDCLNPNKGSHLTASVKQRNKKRDYRSKRLQYINQTLVVELRLNLWKKIENY